MSREPRSPPDFDPDEDLFDFASVARDSAAGDESEENLEEILSSFREAPPSEDLLAVPLAASAPAPTSAVRHEPAAEAPAPRSSAPARRAPAAQADETARDEPPAPAPRRTRRVSTSVLAIALSVTTLNSVLAVVLLRGRPGSVDEVRAVGHERTPAAESGAGLPPPGSAGETGVTGPATQPWPEQTGEPLDHPALEQARGEVARGEFAAARQRLYTLLSVIDRLEEPRREGLEAECQFLIAQALHLEALERLGRSE